MADVVVKMSADEAALWRAQQKIFDQQAKLNAKMREGEKASKSAGDSAVASAEKTERAQRKLNAELDKSQKGFLGIDKAASSLGAMAAGYLSVESAVRLVTQAMQDQMDLQNKSMAAVDRLAVAQQEAVKNFAGLSAADMKKALDIPQQAAAEMKFKDVAKATEAMGELYSTVNDLEKNRSALRVGMSLTQLNPEDVGPVSSGILKLGSSAGVADAKRASGFMASVGAASPVNDPKKLATALAPVVEAAVGMYPGQDKQQAAIDAGALFATITEKGADSKGESGSTNTITLLGKMSGFFSELKNELSDDNKKRNEEIAKLEKSQIVTDKEAVGIKQAEEALKNARTDLQREAATANLKDRIETSTLTAEELKRLNQLKQERALIQSVQDPGTISGQLGLLQSNQALRDMLFSTSFGEERFKVPMKQVAMGGSDTATSFADKRSGITFDASLHDTMAKDVQNKTEYLRLANAKREGEANSNQGLLDPVAGAAGAIFDIRTKALYENRNAGVANFMSETMDRVAPAYYSGDPVRATLQASDELRQRQSLFMRRDDSDGVTARDLQNFKQLDDQLLALAKTLEAVVSQLTASQQQQAKSAIESIRNESINAAARLQAAKAGQ